MLGSPGEDPSYRLNTPQMHANLHTEFLHSVSFLLSEDLNAHLLSSQTRDLFWYSHIKGKLNSAQIERLKFLTAAGLNCNFKSWMRQKFDGTDENDLHRIQSKRENCSSSEMDIPSSETYSCVAASHIAAHSDTNFFVSNASLLTNSHSHL